MAQTLGYHLILDLWQCLSNLQSHDKPSKRLQYVEELIKKEGLTILGKSFNVFENFSWSLNIMLAESHVSIHTWPEKQYVSADVFVCNFTRNNEEAANRIAQKLVEYFQSGKYETNLIRRRGEPHN